MEVREHLQGASDPMTLSKSGALSSALPGPIATPRAKKTSGPLWKGPEVDGVTFSLLSRFLCCRERFRLLVIEGWKAADKFSAPLEFGSMWHHCEEALAGFNNQKSAIRDAAEVWQSALDGYTLKLVQKYPLQQTEVLHWHDMAEALFPQYVKHWADHPDVQKRTPLLQEQVFDIPYQLPSGRTVRLRGKWDSVDLIEEPPVGVYVQEDKTKSQVNRVKLTRQLGFDLQTMLYLVALYQNPSCDIPRDGHYRHGGGQGRQGVVRSGGASPGEYPINGVRYNVVRRSAHKSTESMLKKFTEDRDKGRVDEWLLRFRVEVSVHDVTRFREECLDPVLENCIDDYEWWSYCYKNGFSPFVQQDRNRLFPHHCPKHFRYPFGIYNPMNEGGFSEVDEFLETGSTRGLQRCDNLFPELTE